MDVVSQPNVVTSISYRIILHRTILDAISLPMLGAFNHLVHLLRAPAM